MTISEIKNLIEHYQSELSRLEFQTSITKNALEQLQVKLKDATTGISGTSKKKKKTSTLGRTKDTNRPPNDHGDDWDG